MRGAFQINFLVLMFILVIVILIVFTVAFYVSSSYGKVEKFENYTSDKENQEPSCSTSDLCSGFDYAECSKVPKEDECSKKEDECSESERTPNVTTWTCTKWTVSNRRASDCRTDEKCYCGKEEERKSVLLKYDDEDVEYVEWFLGNNGESCELVCKLFGRKCRELDIEGWYNESGNGYLGKGCKLQNEFLNAAYGLECRACTVGENDELQIYIRGIDECFSMVKGAKKFNCTTADLEFKRLCPCEEA